MAFNTGNPVPSSDPKDLSDNAENFDSAVNTSGDKWTDRLGVQRDTVQGRIDSLGFAVPVAYASGIVFGANDHTKTVEESGVVYAPLPSALPFTTTNFGADSAKFFVVQGVTNESLKSELQKNKYNAEFDTISEAVNSTDSNVIFIGGIVSINERDNGEFKIITKGTTANIDLPNGTFIIALVGFPLLALKLRVIGLPNVRQFGALGGNLTKDTAGFEGAIAYSKALLVLASPPRASIFVPDSPTPYLIQNGRQWGFTDIQGQGKFTTEVNFENNSTDCITTDGNSLYRDIYFKGGWDGSTPGQAGDLIRVTSAVFIGEFHLDNVKLRNARQDSIHCSNLGYSSLKDVDSKIHGRIGLHMDGTTFINTSMRLIGSNIFSSCPNHTGLLVNNAHNSDFSRVILEQNAQGVVLSGVDNRTLKFDGVYQEFNGGTDAFVVAGSAGIGISITNCFGGGLNIPDLSEWFDITMYSNSNFGTIFPSWIRKDIRVAESGEIKPTTSGAETSETALSITLPAGLWNLDCTVQTQESIAITVLRSAAMLITTTQADSAYQKETDNNFKELADSTYTSPSSARARLRVSGQISLSAPTVVYMRVGYDFDGTELAYKGRIVASPFK